GFEHQRPESGQSLMMRQSQSPLSPVFLGFCRQIPRRNGGSERLTLVGAVAKGRVSGLPAPAEGYGCASAQADFLAVLIHNQEVAFYPNGPVTEDSHFCACQGFLRSDHCFI